GAQGPSVTATPARPMLFASIPCTSPPEEANASVAEAIMSAEEELGRYKLETLGKRPAALPLLVLVGEASNCPGTHGALPSTQPPAEEEEDKLYPQSLDIIFRYLHEQAIGATQGRQLEGVRNLPRVADGVQRNEETVSQGMLRKPDFKNENDVKSLSGAMVHVFSGGITKWGRIVTISFGAFVVKHFGSINQEAAAECITDVLLRKRYCLDKRRGGDGLVEFVHVKDPQGDCRNVQLAFAG
uniref:Bcl-2 Bcl-2 homology region 1-3 domain-containing protein n=1 Tax=Loxodonta africana TaxID=9785 RepID=G3TVG9_LOXAF